MDPIVRTRALTAACLLALLAAGVFPKPALTQPSAPPAAPADQDKSVAAPLPAPLSGFTDQGTFFVYKNEERLATIAFTWKPDGSYQGQTTLSLAGQTVKLSLEITPDPEGRFATISMGTPLGPITIVREGGQARKTFKDKTETAALKAGTVLFENMSPALMSQALRLYDRSKAGKQTFPVYILPAMVMDLSLEFQEQVERSVGGKDIKLDRFVYGVPGVDIVILASQDGQVMLAEVPAQHAAYVREGWEALRQAPRSDEKISKPEHQVKVEAGVLIPMRDKVKLATDLYLPDAEGRFPVLLVRTPYKKEMAELQARFFARRGYGVAVQDCRGRFGSEGTWEPFIHEAADGYDTVEWLAAQPWSSGKVGMIGGSYVGWVQWWAARERPPHLVTIIPNVSPPDPFYNIPYEYGVFFLLGAIWWADVLESNATADLSGAAMSKIGDKKYQKLLASLPVIDLDEKILGRKNPYWRNWIQHPTNDRYWEPANFLEQLRKVNLPVFHQSGWFDGDGIGTKLNYLAMAKAGHKNQKLVLGPWGHTNEAHRRYADRDFGEKAIVDLPRDYLRWFDFWLKGTDNGIQKEPLVSLFVMGRNDWLQGPIYPLPPTRFEKWYLGSAGHANTSKGDGRLSPEPPPARSVADRYRYDPADPTPDPNFYEEPEAPADSKAPVRSAEEKKKEEEEYHQKVAEERHDILVYLSEPLAKPLTLVGPVSAVLYASTSAPDTDWFVSLMEVDRDGKIFPLVQGKIRARFRNSMQRPTLLASKKIYTYTLDLWHTGITLPPGNRLRVEVASASFPSFSRNLNTGGHNETETRSARADQTIYHSQQYPSHILLPIIPEDEFAKTAPAPAPNP